MRSYCGNVSQLTQASELPLYIIIEDVRLAQYKREAKYIKV